MGGVTSDDDREAGEQLAEILASLAELLERAAGVIGRISDPHEAFRAASRFATVLRDAATEAARLRTETVARIWTAEKMSLAELAGKIGVSKTRADQLVRATKAGKDGDGQ